MGMKGGCFNLKIGMALNAETIDKGSLFVELIVGKVLREVELVSKLQGHLRRISVKLYPK